MARIIGTWDYHDRDGVLIYQKVKTESDGPLKEKSYYIRRPHPHAKDQWVFGLGKGNYIQDAQGVWRPATQAIPSKTIELPECQPILYRLPELLAAANKPDQPVFVVEGEKDAETLRSLKFVATTGPAGAGKWNFQWGGYFAMRKVVVIPDNDEPGMKYALSVVASCVAYQARSIRYVRWGPEDKLAEHGDITDYLEAGYPGPDVYPARQAVIALAKATPEWVAKEGVS